MVHYFELVEGVFQNCYLFHHLGHLCACSFFFRVTIFDYRVLDVPKVISNLSCPIGFKAWPIARTLVVVGWP